MSFLYYLLILLILPFYSADFQVHSPRTFGYVLQAESLAPSRSQVVHKLRASNRDWLIIDPSYNGRPDRAWSPGEIARMRSGKRNRKILAYLSIGEAESYRSYWQSSWDHNQDGKPDAEAPAFLEKQNEDWLGNYKVHYWDKEWQKIILKRLNRLLKRGFDGVYLDIVDAFEYYEYDAQNDRYIDHRENPVTGHTYRQDMIRWIERIAAEARKKRDPFLIIPQNGAQLAGSSDYLQTISGQAVEDLFTHGPEQQSSDHIEYVTSHLEKVRDKGKPVLLVEYPGNDLSTAVKKRCQEAGFTSLLVTDRSLDQLGSSYSCR